MEYSLPGMTVGGEGNVYGMGCLALISHVVFRKSGLYYNSVYLKKKRDLWA
jgi:hypothetical protein